MKIALERLIEGIIATLRADVIPNIPDAYARGQAVGVIDLLNNIVPKIEWAREPLINAVAEKTALLSEITGLLPEVSTLVRSGEAQIISTAELSAERDRLDAAICEILVLLGPQKPNRSAGTREQVLGLLKRHIHDELVQQMKLTRKPLFAEIASGEDGNVPK
jgi:hypothetical protein